MNPDQMPVEEISDNLEYFRNRIYSGELREAVILFVWKNCNPDWTVAKADMVMEKIYSLLTYDIGDL